MLKYIFLIIVSFASCLGNELNKDAKRFILNSSKSADYIFEGSLISSTKILALEGDKIIPLKDAGKIEKKMSDHLRVEVWMDLIEIGVVYKGKIQKGAQYALFYRKRHPKIASEIEEHIEIDRHISNIVKGGRIGRELIYLIKTENFKIGPKEFPISVSDSILLDPNSVSPELKKVFMEKANKQKPEK